MMTGSQWISIGVVLAVATVTKCLIEETVGQEDVFCPHHTQPIYDEDHMYRACEPYLCVPRGQDDYHSPPLCPDRNRKNHFLDKLLSPSCHWVRLYRGYSYHFSSDGDGSIYESETNVTHHLGHYAYHPQFQEAYICREKLLPKDDTEDITLWCSSHTIYMDEYPTVREDQYENHNLHLPHLNLTVPHGFYEIHQNPQGYGVNVCLNTSLEFMRCEPKTTLQYFKTQFELLSNLSLLVNWTEPIVYPVGHYYLSADNKSAIVCIKETEKVETFTSSSGQPMTDIVLYFVSLFNFIRTFP